MLSILAPAQAQAAGQTVQLTRLPNSVVFDCNVDGSNSLGWVSSKVLINYAANSGNFSAWEAHIRKWNGKPVVGQVAKDSDGRLVFHWQLDAVGTRGSSTVVYDATLSTDHTQVFVRERISGFSNFTISTGTCTQH